MADKKSFILYLDHQELFNKLPDDVAGRLIKHIFAYVNDENPETSDLLLDIAFSSIKQALKRDLGKWEDKIEQKRAAGRASAEKRAQSRLETAESVENNLTNPTPVESVKDILTNPTVSVNENVSVNESVNVSVNEITTTSAKANLTFDLFKYWCDVMGKNLSTSKLTSKRDKAIKGRLKEGYTFDQIKAAIDGCRNDPWSMGHNDRQKSFNDIELICRTGEKLEGFIQTKVEPRQFSASTERTISMLQDVELP
mgnify:CR=1 FL=1